MRDATRFQPTSGRVPRRPGPHTIVVLSSIFLAGWAGCGEERAPERTNAERVTAEGARTHELPGPADRTTSSVARQLERLPLDAAEALGQALVGRFSGTAPSKSFLLRVRSGELGGVILFGDNVADGTREVRRMTQLLQREAVGGGNPPLLILIDQEGGDIERLPGPPGLSPEQMGRPPLAEREGRRTGRFLRNLGINVNLAPVVDVPMGETFIRERTFGANPAEVAERACAFADGLLAAGVAATLKHFPGLGRAYTNTDAEPTTVHATPDALRADYLPYRTCGQDPRNLTMVSSARYPRLTGDLPAVMSAATYDIELPNAGATGPTISDDLETPALAEVSRPAGTALAAGLSLALYAKTEAGSAEAHSALRGQLEGGSLDAEDLRRNVLPVLALKALLEPDLAGRYLRRQHGR